MNEKIGIVCWGTKLGLSFFVSSDHIDTTDSVILDTLKDIRAVIRFNNANNNFYAIEFTDKYKVYTKYKSVFDSNNSVGGFLAITIYIPHGYTNNDTVDLLDKLMDVYTTNGYLDSYFRLLNKRENPKLFFDIINKTKLFPTHSGDRYTSPSNNNYGVIFYEREKDLEGYFSNPYRNEFKKYQEIFLMSKEIGDKKKFNSIETITTAKPIVEEYTIASISCVDKINHVTISNIKSSLSINDRHVNLSNKFPINETDIIKVEVTSKHYKTKKVEGTLENLVRNGLIQKDNSNIVFSSIKMDRETIEKMNVEVFYQNNPILKYDLIFNNNTIKPNQKGIATITRLNFIDEYEIEIKAHGYNEKKKKIKEQELNKGNASVHIDERKQDKITKNTKSGTGTNKSNKTTKQQDGTHEHRDDSFISKLTFNPIYIVWVACLLILFVGGYFLFMKPNPVTTTQPDMPEGGSAHTIIPDSNSTKAVHPKVIDSLKKNINKSNQEILNDILTVANNSGFVLDSITNAKETWDSLKEKDDVTNLSYKKLSFISKDSSDFQNSKGLDTRLELIENIAKYKKEKTMPKGWNCNKFHIGKLSINQNTKLDTICPPKVRKNGKQSVENIFKK